MSDILRYYRLARQYGFQRMIRKCWGKMVYQASLFGSAISSHLVRLLVYLLSVMLRFSLCRGPYLLAISCCSFPEEIRNCLRWTLRRAVTLHPPLNVSLRTGKALIVYHSRTGNTEKVASAIQRGVRQGGLEPIKKEVSEAFEEELYNYDLVCLGTPVIHSLPAPPVMDFILEKGKEYRKRKEVRLPAQTIPGKNALVFVTFSGPHLGLDEALPAGKYLRQFFGHLGFQVRGEWYIVGEFHEWPEASIQGYLGDIRGRPSAEDLARVEERTIELVKSLYACAESEQGDEGMFICV